ncbi:sodium/glucose cotransporter 4-like [Branchiostoma lanceolatum]|uniref:sodium/glucose cotransporter 4-like n=1 Tax=Branchiostoma lanceolatum TaxID=7740 RepID=UPI003452D541
MAETSSAAASTEGFTPSTTGGTPSVGRQGVEAADIVVIAVYFVLIMAVGIWSMVKANRGTVTGYFLAGRSMWWGPIGLSLYGSNIGSTSFIGLAGTGAASGIAVSAYELSGLFCLLLLAWLYIPVYISSAVTTMPQYLKKRFGGRRLQIYLSVLALIQYIFIKISADMFAGALFIQLALGWSLYPSILLLLAITAVYTIGGGLTAVMYTDAVSVCIMVIGAIILMVMAFVRVGGIETLITEYFQSIPDVRPPNTTCGVPTLEAFHLFRDATGSDLPWPGLVFGIFILSAWYFCTDQVLVQRSLAAKNMTHAKGGSILAAGLKILPLFLMVMPGMISRVLFKDDVACVTAEECVRACGNPASCTNIAYPKLVIELMPVGLRGLMVATMLAALMSSLTSVFNSSSSIFTVDLWGRVRRKASQRELMLVGRLFVLVMVGVGILWIPVVQAAQGGQLFDYIQSITSYQAPPVLACFTLGILWPRTNEPGAFWGMIIGLVVGTVRLILDFSYGFPRCGEPDNRPDIITRFHFLHFAILLFTLCIVATVVISLLTEPQDKDKLVRLTWWTRHNEEMPVDLSDSEEEEEEETEKEENGELQLEVTEQDVQVQDGGQRGSRSMMGMLLTGWNWFCGFSDIPTKKQTKAEKAASLKVMTSLKEDRFWGRFVNITALVLMTIGIFFWGFFA